MFMQSPASKHSEIVFSALYKTCPVSFTKYCLSACPFIGKLLVYIEYTFQLSNIFQFAIALPKGKVKSAYEPNGPSGRSLSRFP